LFGRDDEKAEHLFGVAFYFFVEVFVLSKRGVIVLLLIFVVVATAFAEIELKFYYPVGVSGPLARVIDGMTQEFNDSHPGITVVPVYCGNYDDTMQKVQTAVMSKNPPDIAVVEISELYSLLAMDAILPLDDYITAEGEEFLDQFWPAFFGNAIAKDKIWGFPFQRSTPVFYYNKDLFKKHSKALLDAGLDPNRAPRTWYELIDYARILTERKGNETTVYGLILPGGWNDWIFEAFLRQNDSFLIDQENKKANFDSPEALQALNLWYKLTTELKVSPPLRPWNMTITDFVSGNAAMMYYSTGGMPTVRSMANFDFGVAFLPMHVTYGTPVGGGDFHIFKNIPKANQDAAWEYIKFMTTPEKAAYWSMVSGYVSVNKDSYELPEMIEFLDGFPQMWTAANQLEFSYPKMMAVNYQQIRKIMVTNLDAVQLGNKTPQKALQEMQKEIQAILDRYSF